LNVRGKVKAPKIENPEMKGDSNIPVFDIPPTKIEIRKSIPKPETENELTLSKSSIDAKIEPDLKKYKPKQSKVKKEKSSPQPLMQKLKWI
jgi:hypothetical protein